MLSVKLKAFDRACGPTTGGVSRVYIFDRDDFDFTQAAASVDGDMPPYSAVARREDATAEGGAKMFPVKFEKDEAEYKYTMTRKGSSRKYDHELSMLLSDLGHFITQWNQKVDAAGACNGIGLIIVLNSGKILVMGEKYVNDAIMATDFYVAQDGATGTSGKLRDDANGHTAVLKGDFDRGLYEFSGGIAAIDALANN